MGDRTTVTFMVPMACAEQACALLEKTNGKPYDQYDSDDYQYFVWDDVNYGNLNNLEAVVRHGIPFDATWGDGHEYYGGTLYCRFTSEGEVEIKSIYESEENPPLQRLLDNIDRYEELRDYILNYKKNITPLPWDNQVEYGQRFRVNELINPRRETLLVAV